MKRILKEPLPALCKKCAPTISNFDAAKGESKGNGLLSMSYVDLFELELRVLGYNPQSIFFSCDQDTRRRDSEAG